MSNHDTGVHIGIIGGTGLGEHLFGNDRALGTLSESSCPETPFGTPSGPIETGTLADGTRLSLLARHGEGHVLNPHEVPYRANVYALKMLGVTHVIASGAVGSLREQIQPGHVALVDQFIDKTDGRPRTFYHEAAVHVEFADPCCPVMRKWLSDAAQAAGIAVHETATYVCMEGPAFSTRAESEMHRQWGGDLIGMTALPEARLAREAELAYALVALPTDYDCWKQHDAPTGESLLQEIIANLETATSACVALIKQALSDTTSLQQEVSPAHRALDLAIWSDKSKIDPAEVQRLHALWGRCFE
ncbi:MAG: S-methyl-5'-thioadenosine phosphorylase [Planctomycetes bacterium]|nr:S-methyl-5'-thioadenosine phosphorylase [Planctomycetota bacterium]NOG55197.1 S-methyl-5'-thioadenosine phosphorylase [Planctomycetota bacterium]